MQVNEIVRIQLPIGGVESLAQPAEDAANALVARQDGINLLQRAEGLEPLQGGFGPRFVEDELKLVADAPACDAPQQRQRLGDERLAARIEVESQPRFEAGRAQDAGGIFHKAHAVQHANDAIPQVGAPAEEVEGLPPMRGTEPDRQGVDGEIAAVEILFDGAPLHGGERGGVGVEFGPRRHEINERRQSLASFFRQIWGDGAPDFGIEQPLGGAKPAVLADFAAELVDERAAQRDGVAFDHQIYIENRLVEQQVAHDAAHEVEVFRAGGGPFTDLADEAEQRRGECALHSPDDVLAFVLLLGGRQPNEIRPGDNAENLVAADDGNLPPAFLDHQGADPFGGIFRRDLHRAGVHDAADGLVAPVVLQGAIHGVARDQAHHFALMINDGKALMPGVDHALRHILNAIFGVDGAHGVRHQIPDGVPGVDEAGQGFAQCRRYGANGLVAEQGGGGAGVSSPAKVLCDGIYVDVIGGAAGHHLCVRIQPHEDKERGRLEQVAQFVRQRGDFFIQIGRGLRPGDDDGMSADVQGFDVGEERFVERLLFRRERMVQEVVGDVEAGVVIQQPAGGAEVAGSSGRVREAAGILVDAREHECGFDTADGHQPGGQGFHK